MKFDIDVSGEDVLSNGFVICIATKDNVIKGFKFSGEIVRRIHESFKKCRYNRYKQSKKRRGYSESEDLFNNHLLSL